MRDALRRLFNLYPGEGRSASLFLILGFLWSLGAFGGLTLSEGMFLEHVGAAGLPTSYLLTAGCMCGLATLLLYALHRLSIPHLLFSVITSVIALQLLLSLFLALGFETKALWYLFKVCGWISPIAIYICFWAFIDQYYDLQDAKRCFCLFNSVLYLGDACGGALISFTLDKIAVGSLLLLFVLSLTSSLPLIYLITKRRKTVPEESHDGNFTSSPVHLTTLLRKVLASPFTLVLMLFYFLMQLMAITTEYTYMEAFEKAFASSSHPHTLTEFLGKLAMWVSLGNMLFGLFFYSRTVTRIGVNNIILIAPLFFLSLFFCWSWQQTLLVALLAFIAREGMTYTFDDNNLLLLISGVPTKIKNQVRIAIESFFEPIGMLAGASLLLLLQERSKLLGLVLATIALFVVLILRSHYTKALFENLMAHSIHFEKRVGDWLATFSKKERKNIEMALLANLKKNDEVVQLLAFETLLKMENGALLPHLLNQASRFSIRGKLHVIQLLSQSPFAQESVVVERFEQWKKMLPHSQIRMAITFYFATHKLAKREQMIQHIDSEHLTLRGAAILTLKTFPEKVAHSLTALEKLKQLLNSSDEKEICMGLTILGSEKRGENLKELLPYLKHPQAAVCRSAARAIALCAEPSVSQFADMLTLHLGQTHDPEVQGNCLAALEKMGQLSHLADLILTSIHFRPRLRKEIERIALAFGKEALAIALPLLLDEEIHLRSRVLSAKIVSKLAPIELKNHLRTLVTNQMEKALFYSRHAHHFRENPSLLILEQALHASYSASVDFIIELIALSGSLEECEVVVFALRSKNRKIRAHALETLEKSADPALFTLVSPLFRERTPYLKKEGPLLSWETVLDHLEHSPSKANQIVCKTLKERMSDRTAHAY